MSDNEDARAYLGDAEVASVQHSPAAAIPELLNPPDEGAEVPSAVGSQGVGDVLPEEPARPGDVNKSQILEGQVAASPWREKDWQGVPPTSRSIRFDLKVSSSCILVMSPRFGMPGRRRASTREGNAPISDSQAGSQPRGAHAAVAASIPLHTLPYTMFSPTGLNTRPLGLIHGSSASPS